MMKKIEICPLVDNLVLEKNKLYVKFKNGSMEYMAINPKGKKVSGIFSEKQLGFPITEMTKISDLAIHRRDIFKVAARKGVLYDPVLFFIYPFGTGGDRA